jgi:hypothetical protein
MPSFVSRSVCADVLPIATMTLGSTFWSCSWRYGMHVADSTAVGRLLPGGRHLMMLQM